MEPSAKRTANRIEALVSLYLSCGSLHPKEPPKQITHKSTKVDLSDRLELEKNFTKPPNRMLFSILKHSFPRIQGQLMPMTGVISGVVTPKDKTKSNPLARLKVRIFTKSVNSQMNFHHQLHTIAIMQKSLYILQFTNMSGKLNT